MSRKLHVLIVEDSEDNALIILQELRGNGYDPVFERVDSLKTMNTALDKRAWDIVISDYSMTGFNWADALKLIKDRAVDRPFIIVSGDIGGETAVEMIKAGAHDYIMRDNLSRLVPSVEFQLKEADLRKKRKRTEERLMKAAMTDELTGLLNRRGFFALAQQQIRIADRLKKRVQLHYMDIDGVKTINDKLGHKTGDQALIDAATILKRTFRKSDITGRIGGDEFVVVSIEPPDNNVWHEEINRFNNNVNVFNKKAGRQYDLIFSIGTAHYDPDQPCTFDELLIRADQLMYEVKRVREPGKQWPHIRKKERPERNAQERFCPGDDFFVTIDGTRAVLKDIGTGGACLITSRPLNAYGIYKIKILPPDKHEISPSGIVVWSSLTKKGSNKNNKPLYYEAGLKFVRLSCSNRTSIASLINNLAGLP